MATHNLQFASCGLPASERANATAMYSARESSFGCPSICHHRRTSPQAGLKSRTGLFSGYRALRDQSPKLCGETASRIALVAAADRQAESQEPHQEPKAIERGEFGVILKLGVISFAGAAFIKYGELLLGNLPYSHSLPVSLTMIIGPCVLFSIILALKSR